MIPAAALLCALAAAGDPCLVTDEAGRTFRACFDPGNRLEAAAGVRAAGGGGSELSLSAAWRWRSDTTGQGGAAAWRRDQAVLETEGLLRRGVLEEARVVGWRGTFVRRVSEPFILLPGPRPLRLPFPFDVGMALEAAGARWARAREREAALTVVRSTLLLDLSRHLGSVRRAALGPELAYDLWLSRDEAPTHVLSPFTGATLDLALESADGRWQGTLTARAGSALRVPGGFEGYAAGALAIERVVAAVNDRPLALGVALRAEHGATGPGPARAEALLVLRVAAPR